MSRLFFGLSIHTIWPSSYPKGKIIQENARHVTLAFLGERPLDQVLDKLSSMPPFPFEIGPTGLFTDCLFFPHRHPHCAVWQIEWQQSITSYQENLISWLVTHKLIEKPKRAFTSHITLARAPFIAADWKKRFSPAALYVTGVHLFESLGNSTYKSHWQKACIDPFVELEHTADIAFLIRGKTVHDLYLNAQIALSFRFSELIPFLLKEQLEHDNIDEVVRLLNATVSRCDSEIGSPLKAISYHGDIKIRSDALLEWEMILDV